MTAQTIPVCRTCRIPLERDIVYGGLRYYVCRGCGGWAIPFPPDQDIHHRVSGEPND